MGHLLGVVGHWQCQRAARGTPLRLMPRKERRSPREAARRGHPGAPEYRSSSRHGANTSQTAVRSGRMLLGVSARVGERLRATAHILAGILCTRAESLAPEVTVFADVDALCLRTWTLVRKRLSRTRFSRVLSATRKRTWRAAGRRPRPRTLRRPTRGALELRFDRVLHPSVHQFVLRTSSQIPGKREPRNGRKGPSPNRPKKQPDPAKWPKGA